MGGKHFGAGILLLGTSIGSARAADPVSRFLHLYGSEFKNPSDVAFLSKGAALVTQRTDGKVILWNKGKKTTVLDLPVANGKGQGLLDISLSSIFNLDHHVELTFTGAAKDGGRSTGLDQRIYRWSPTAKKLTLVNTDINIGEAVTGGGTFGGSGGYQITPISGSLNIIAGSMSLNTDTDNVTYFSGASSTTLLDPVSSNVTATDPISGTVGSTFSGSFTLADVGEDSSLPGYHLIDFPVVSDFPVVTFPTTGQLTISNTPEPASGAILLAGAGALMKRRRRHQ